MALSVDIVLAAVTIASLVLNVVQLIIAERQQSAFFSKLALATMKAHRGDFKPLEDLQASKSWLGKLFGQLTGLFGKLARFVGKLASRWTRGEAEQLSVFASTINGTKVFLDFRGYSAQEEQDPIRAATAIYEGTVRWCTFVACALDYTAAMGSRGELASKRDALRLRIDALKAKLGSLCFNENLEEETTAHGPLQQEIAMAEGDMQSLQEETRRKDLECSALVAKYRELKQAFSGDPAWKVSTALLKKLQEAENLQRQSLDA